MNVLKACKKSSKYLIKLLKEGQRKAKNRTQLKTSRMTKDAQADRETRKTCFGQSIARLPDEHHKWLMPRQEDALHLSSILFFFVSSYSDGFKEKTQHLMKIYKILIRLDLKPLFHNGLVFHQKKMGSNRSKKALS